ncbi:hypothetical protein V1525DRAFT_400209 [Lipomyces kononenkoae]|uniref:Uncharacterized protein n=1 Tax=Lipomyces kononenkoae TaxID=34357 RepID=A0ACC3T727_LIPKO
MNQSAEINMNTVATTKSSFYGDFAKLKGEDNYLSWKQDILKSSTKLLEGLFLLMHLTYGSPARMTEINTWKHVNSVNGPRNIYCHTRGLLGLYNKTTSLTGMERVIVHLVPARLEMMRNLLMSCQGIENAVAALLVKQTSALLKANEGARQTQESQENARTAWTSAYRTRYTRF